MPKKYIRVFEGDQNPDQTANPAPVELETWIFLVTIDDKNTYVEVPWDQYQNMKSLINNCDSIQLIETYVAIYEPDADGFFDLLKEKSIKFIKFRVIAQKCIREQKH